MSSELISAFWRDNIEYPLDKVGLLRNRTKRFAVFTAGSALALWLLKPTALFDEEGNPRKEVPVHWTIVSGLIGVSSLLFV